MASSGSFDFSVNRDEIIKAALRLVNKNGGLGEDPTVNEINDAAQSLNMLVKQWQGDQDTGTGFKTWSRKTGYVFLQTDQTRYILGPGGDPSSSAFVRTALSVAQSPGQTILNVDSLDGIAAGDRVGIEMDDGFVHWSTVSGFSGSGIVVVSGLANNASAGNLVTAYTTQMARPLTILTAKLVDTNGDEIAVDQINLEQYQSTPNKSLSGTPQRIYYEQHVDTGFLFTDFAPDDVTRYLSLVFLSPIEDFDAATDTPDYPQEWFRALKLGLAYDLWPEYHTGERPNWLIMDRAEAKAIASNAVPEEDIGGFFESRW